VPVAQGAVGDETCTGSYYSGEYIYDTLMVSDRDSYRVDERRAR
jgi:hypothetical protein